MFSSPVRSRTRSHSARFSLACVWTVSPSSAASRARAAQELVGARDRETRLHGDAQPPPLPAVPVGAEALGLRRAPLPPGARRSSGVVRGSSIRTLPPV